MGTRSGDIDPGVFGYLAERAGLTVDEAHRGELLRVDGRHTTCQVEAYVSKKS